MSLEYTTWQEKKEAVGETVDLLRFTWAAMRKLPEVGKAAGVAVLALATTDREPTIDRLRPEFIPVIEASADIPLAERIDPPVDEQ